eukprot:1155538-Pelagomonas_calceolata.AAC.1
MQLCLACIDWPEQILWLRKGAQQVLPYHAAPGKSMPQGAALIKAAHSRAPSYQGLRDAKKARLDTVSTMKREQNTRSTRVCCLDHAAPGKSMPGSSRDCGRSEEASELSLQA